MSFGAIICILVHGAIIVEAYGDVFVVELIVVVGIFEPSIIFLHEYKRSAFPSLLPVGVA